MSIYEWDDGTQSGKRYFNTEPVKTHPCTTAELGMKNFTEDDGLDGEQLKLMEAASLESVLARIDEKMNSLEAQWN